MVREIAILKLHNNLIFFTIQTIWQKNGASLHYTNVVIEAIVVYETLCICSNANFIFYLTCIMKFSSMKK